ncbi:hypothetical protein FO647_10075, partial [Riemerella anatipestifer]|nr:hypothetical protein [Riemerella anatipestifer]
LFRITFLSKLAIRKKHSLRLVEIELLVQFSPPFANTFSVARNTTETHATEIKLNFCDIKETESKPNEDNVERFEFI